MKKRFLRTSILLLMLVMVLFTAVPVGAAPAFVQIDILSVNDFHGALAEAGKNPGAAKLAGWLKAEQAKNPQGTLILSAGDMFQGSVDSNLLYGKTVVDMMNRTGFAAMALGNHEFDWGIGTLQLRARQAGFPFVAANVIENATGKPLDFTKPYIIVEKQGIKIAIVGIATPETAYKTNPKRISNLTFADPAATFRELLPRLKRQADVIVVLAHLGGAVDQASGVLTGEAAEFVAQSTDVDALLTGHSHEGFAVKMNRVPVVQARYNGRAVGKITLLYSIAAKQVLASSAELIDLEPAALTADAGVAKILNAAKAEIEPAKNLVLGKTVRPLSHERRQLSLLGQWSSDVIKQAVGADIALQNGGGLRTSIPAGKVAMGQLYEIMPFDNTLVTAELTGAQILQILEYGIHNQQIGMLQFSGIKVIYDSSLPAGKRVAQVVLSDGRPLQADTVYKVVTNDFMASGGDGYTMFASAGSLTDTCQPVRDVLVDAIRDRQTIDFSGDDRLTEVWSITKQTKPAA